MAKTRLYLGGHYVQRQPNGVLVFGTVTTARAQGPHIKGTMVSCGMPDEELIDKSSDLAKWTYIDGGTLVEDLVEVYGPDPDSDEE